MIGNRFDTGKIDRLVGERNCWPRREAVRPADEGLPVSINSIDSTIPIDATRGQGPLANTEGGVPVPSCFLLCWLAHHPGERER